MRKRFLHVLGVCGEVIEVAGSPVDVAAGDEGSATGECEALGFEELGDRR